MMRQCNKCFETKLLADFEITKKGGKEYRRNTCSKCKNSHDYRRTKETGRYATRRTKQKEKRHLPALRPWYVLIDANLSDKKRCFDNNLDVEFVADLIKNGCFYCGGQASDNMKVGMDRIDNSRGHSKDNVNACCSRCNFIRRDMPYEVWELLVPVIRIATERGLMENWEYGIKHHHRRIREKPDETDL